MDKLKLIYKLLPITLAIITAFAIYVAYKCWQDERLAVARENQIKIEFEQYKQSNNAVKQLELNIIETIQNGQAKTDALRNDVDNGLIELRVQVETIERDSTATSNIANKALRLARTSQQDYYNLSNAIEYNKVIIEGWQKYYCKEIAPKNNTEFMCKGLER
ncbi:MULTISPECIES: lysis system i-spanin subunit Rz [unclassified Gilliamella]|uniref:lysis system i-spanin subunit Rz n=1 Tax=unclassified Gilliamella TaxID=2685620 RepID=UPI00226A2307|nr:MULTISPECIES: lysis system i-spanin subunit Rz [unclassified Gilliamella]MCX8641684.1 lysis protein [Gilliamella sp. B3835]MCX8706485.1 lysis protein [Gilliamella sp. B3783]MCX8709172.1 lysis protein [Gilliamella sp. B3780]MCX8714544.1 lysis protein [Gilliamella sp. B3781]MCX8715911.1 lysis protein [Gilliamella sp. B3784]